MDGDRETSVRDATPDVEEAPDAKEGASHAADEYSRRGADGYVRRRRQRRRHRILKTVLISLAVVVVAAGTAVAAYVHHINSAITGGVDDSLRDSLVETKDPGDPFYMLLLGVDKDESRVQDDEYGSDYSAYRTDTIILARIDPQEKKVTLVSIPRDTMVDMGENGTQKINAAYSIGGASYAVEVVSEFAGVDISHYAEIDMDGFAKVVDTIGGVEVDLPVAVYDPDYTGLDLPAGKQTLDGETAALLGRARHAYDSYGGGDFYREANQRMLIGAVIDKVMQSDASTIVSTITTLSGYVTTDMDVNSIVSLAMSFTDIDVDEDVYSGACPTISEYENDTWYEVCDVDAWEEVMARVDEGLPPYSSSDQDFTAGVAGSVGVSTDDSSDSSSDASTSDSGTDEVTPEYTGTVLCLNASSANGVAGTNAERLSAAGFTTSTGSTGVIEQTTAVYYNGDAQAKADGVVETLGLGVTPTANDGTWDTSVDVVVVIGDDVALSS